MRPFPGHGLQRPQTRTRSGRVKCGKCGLVLESWSARCPRCQAWIQLRAAPSPAEAAGSSRASEDEAAPRQPRTPNPEAEDGDATEGAENARKLKSQDAELRDRAPSTRSVPIAEVDVRAEHTRVRTGIDPLDDVLGGGAVVGSLILLAGDPGAGKSTLLTQMSAAVTQGDAVTLYVSGEETEQQIAVRSHRLDAARPGIRLVMEPSIEGALWHARDVQARSLIIDSVQAMTTDAVGGVPGSPPQVEACIQLLMRFAKSTKTTTFAISQMNKDGELKGPKGLEHAGDVTLRLGKMFPDIPEDPWRKLNAVKNRFGATDQTGLFRMTNKGLIPASRDELPEAGSSSDRGDRDEMAPIAQELLYLLIEQGIPLDAGLRDRIAGRLDASPRSRGT